MHFRLEHVAIHCNNLDESIDFYRNLFAGAPTEVRRGREGYRFCFIRISGECAIQLIESKGETGVHHYGFITEDVDQVGKDLKEKGAKVIRELQDANGKLSTIFLQDPQGLQIEVRLPR